MQVQIIADSISEAHKRITTFQLRYPRFVHAELMTHRVFSRNARSSRAVPTKVLLEEIEKMPAQPLVWGKNMPGMQAKEELGIFERVEALAVWMSAAQHAAAHARKLAEIGCHKQIVNRVIEPFSFINTVVTSTEWENWYGLRVHEDAQPEIRILATEMLRVHRASKPKLLRHGEWHLPYVVDDDIVRATAWTVSKYGERADANDLLAQALLAVSTARCARVSYKAHDGSETSIGKDMELTDALVGAQPMHASPAEHQATPDERNSQGDLVYPTWKFPELHGNFVGWKQHRKFLLGEKVAAYPDARGL